MKTYGIINCPDCGIEITKLAPSTKRCKPCALSAHGETKSGYKVKKCIVCDCDYKPSGTTQKVCETCKPAYRQQQNITALKEMRKKAGAVVIGTILMCPECADDFVYKAGPQHRCPSCQKQEEVKKIYAWLASNKDRVKKYTEKAKDNYNFGGNRTTVLERDNYTCQHCQTKDDLHVHHIDGKGTTTERELRNNAIDNLITLCRGCHTKEHHRIRHSNCAPQTKMPE